MKGIRKVYTAEQLYEQLQHRLALSDAWIAEKHPGLLRAADAMVEALQKKESYGGGVAQRAGHLASHLKATDPMLARWMEKQQALEAAKAAREAAATPALDSPCPGSTIAAAGAAATATTTAIMTPPPLPASQGGVGKSAASGEATAAAAATGSVDMDVVGAVGGNGLGASARSNGSPSPRKGSSSSKGGAATALEYLCTTFAHLREQRTLVMGDKKDRLLKEVAGLRQMRAGAINVLRGGKASETTMADMLAALKAADADPRAETATARSSSPSVEAGASVGVGPMEADAAAQAPANSSAFTDTGSGSQAADPGSMGHLDNLTCVVWEDWRIPERLDKLLQAGDTVCVYVEVHCRDGPEDTRLAMRFSTFVALALCSQRLIAELYQDMFIMPQRAASARPQRKRQRTASEETVQTLDESPDSLDFVDFVEALHRRMPLRCGWMYANAILPNAGEWDRVFGHNAGRLSGLYDGGPELDALGRACLAFHHTRHESPVLDVHVLASQLRQQQQQWQPAGASQQQQRLPAGWPRSAVELATASVVAKFAPTDAAVAVTACGSTCCSSSSSAAPAPPSLMLRPPQDSSGRGQGLDLGHLSFTCVTAAPLSDDFLGEVIRQTTAGQAAAEVAAAAAAAAALRASRCIASGRVGCTGTCVEDAAAAAAAAEVAAAAAADYMSWGGLEGESLEDEERELFDAVNEELRAVEEAAVKAEQEVEVEMEMMEVQTRIKKEEEQQLQAVAPGVTPCATTAATTVTGSGLHLKGAFSHRMQLMPGVFFSYYIGSQAFTNTAWHVEDFLLQSINMMMVGRPKAWWWVPRDKEAVFKEYLEDQWDAEDVYTKSVPLASIPLEKLIKMGVRRSVQLPGAIFITSPGYAFHTTMSSGWSMADSANFMANIVGKDMHVLEDERPLEQYPPTEGRTNTGEWVRFTMRRIEELRARNDPTYQPRPLRRIREQVQARRAAAAAAAVAAGPTAMKAEHDDVGGDKMLTAPERHDPTHEQGHSHGSHRALKVKVEHHDVGGIMGPQSPTRHQQPQQQQQSKPRQRNDKALLQAYMQAKAAHKAEVQAAAQAAALRRQARATARNQQSPPPASGGQPDGLVVTQSPQQIQAPPPAPPASRKTSAKAAAAPSSGKEKSAPAVTAAAPQQYQSNRKQQPPKRSAPIAAGMTEQQKEETEQQQQQRFQQQLAMPCQPVYFMVPEQALGIEVQPQNFSEQELLAGLLPGVLRGLLPEATVLLKQQKQLQYQQQERLRQPSGAVQPAPERMEYSHRHHHQQDEERGEEEKAVGRSTDPMEGIVEDGAAGGVVAMEMPWRVAVA
ncbi:hypothetical protein Vretimale_4045 [Volvox reticuliferus]|uniref:JmjC domain-containing protein n=1 Tax=Volvox reticuliferus TaxID=1737510 RepID=A0A8J4C0S4_9CHLO|nr:hypothetical protein Vretifemale_1607 [Volvox reticuliferus]GIL98661.1 hypothetical protein Vretimale_4045 [Volvox reticuliferus]